MSARPLQYRPEVGVLLRQSIHPVLVLCPPQLRFRRFCERPVVRRMPTPARFKLAAYDKLFQRVLVNRFQHREVRLTVYSFDLAHQALVYERGQPIENGSWEIGDRGWGSSSGILNPIF